VPDFVSSNAGEHDAHQRQVSRPIGRGVHRVFGPENEQGQDQKRQMKANFDAEQSPHVN
jgi:hypothetical protein